MAEDGNMQSPPAEKDFTDLKIATSLQELQQAAKMKILQAKLGRARDSPKSLPDATTEFDAGRLKDIIDCLAVWPPGVLRCRGECPK